jgi:putative membrane protein
MSAHSVGAISSTAFVHNAARSDMYEVRAGELAKQRATSPQIKQFADEMVRAHTKTTAALKEALAKSGAKVQAPTELDQRRKGLLSNLQASSGAEFDKRYVAQQIAAHQEALDLMKGYADHGDNPVLKEAAAKTAPLVAEHLRMAKALPGA